ncbi:hypothetical protein DD592_27590 [Enterobacter cloacae complex sp. 2DZ2F20B]|nr:hypothetical protein DD592_27590 [Enterobacter cloacae complex sp. 2DZ2F20B]
MANDQDNLIEKHRGIYGFKVKKPNGQEGYWVINAKVGKGSIEFNSKGESRFLNFLYYRY